MLALGHWYGESEEGNFEELRHLRGHLCHRDTAPGQGTAGRARARGRCCGPGVPSDDAPMATAAPLVPRARMLRDGVDLLCGIHCHPRIASGIFPKTGRAKVPPPEIPHIVRRCRPAEAAEMQGDPEPINPARARLRTLGDRD